jgi:hypothetical protein
MTDVTFERGEIIYVEKLQINGGHGPPADLADGELYIDETARLIYIKTQAGMLSVPLDIQQLPPLPPGYDPFWVLIKTALGAAWGPFLAGGGGQPYDARAWRIPGLAPQALGTVQFPAQTGLMSVFDVSKPSIVGDIRLRSTVGSGSVKASLYRYDGLLREMKATVTIPMTATGGYTRTLGVQLDPGLYAWVLESTANLRLETVLGYLTWSRQAEAHAVSMQVT